MIGDSLRRVRQVEEEAEDLIEEAAEEADRLASVARQDYSMTIMAAERRARKEGEVIREQILKEAEEEVKAIRKDHDWERKMLYMEGNRRMDGVVGEVLQALGLVEPGKADGG